MIGVALKGLLGRKTRAILTALAIVLGTGNALAQLPHFLDRVLISCGLAGAFSDYFGSIA